MKVAVYCRVSTVDQKDQGTSLDTQADECRAYAAGRGWEVVEVYQEQYSGEYIDRPLLSKVRAMVTARTIGAVLVYDFDRLSRSQFDPFTLAGEMISNGVLYVSVTEGEIRTREDVFMKLGLSSYRASTERDKIRTRTMTGRKAKAERGIPAGGRIPYGYKWRVEPLAGPHDKRNEITRRTGLDLDSATAPHVEMLFRRIAEGIPLRQVAADMQTLGIATPSGKAKWAHTTVRAILTNPTYMGKREEYKHIGVPSGNGNKRKSVLRDEAERIPLPDGVVTPLIDETTFMAVQRRLELNKEHSKRNSHYPPEAAMLRGFAVCGICGSKMQVGEIRSGSYQYRCYHRGRSVVINPGEPKSNTIPCAELDTAVWGQFYALLSKPEMIAGALAQVERDDPTAGDLAAVDSAEKEATRQLHNLVNQLANVSGTLANMVQDKADTLVTQIAYLQQEKERLLARQNAWRAAQARLDDLKQWCRQVESRLKHANHAIRKEAFIAFGLVIRVHPTTHVPRWDGSTNLKFEFMDRTSA